MGVTAGSVPVIASGSEAGFFPARSGRASRVQAGSKLLGCVQTFETL
jgi:hypothetical protein